MIFSNAPPVTHLRVEPVYCRRFIDLSGTLSIAWRLIWVGVFRASGCELFRGNVL
ncbi:hypothetical protein Pla52n_69310 [Stieleria varia]|uniref:Uncharacterized protein n=1 Tax=Stieleria varia TaxID=2528005 RepID=A0A5C5ZKN5_9BACT|nr:hypothetical protein Pla52n_69310 [Stieleria varia]